MSETKFYKVTQEYQYRETNLVSAKSRSEAERRFERGEVTRRKRSKPSPHLKPRVLEITSEQAEEFLA